MQLTPRYGSDPLIVLDGPPAAIREPTLAQRRRFLAALVELTDDQWAAPSRCEGWTTRDVVLHLDSTNRFWSYSVRQGLAGEPSTLLATFDPAATPAAMVAGERDTTAAEALERFTASTTALVDLLASLDEADWTRPAEAPPGHVSVSALAHHALWDSWVHERDVLLPLGLGSGHEPDEVAACLRYAAALGPGLAIATGSAGRGGYAVVASDPACALTVEVTDRVEVRAGAADVEVVLRGDAVALTEALSMRRPLEQAVPDDAAWMFDGLAAAFDLAPVRP